MVAAVVVVDGTAVVVEVGTAVVVVVGTAVVVMTVVAVVAEETVVIGGCVVVGTVKIFNVREIENWRMNVVLNTNTNQGH